MLEYPAPPAAPVSAAVTTAQIFPNQSQLTVPSVLAIPGTGRLEQKRFKVRASGSGTTAAATTTLLATLYAGQSLTAANNTAIAALTATVINTTTAGWWLEALLIFDSISGNLGGQFAGLINNTIVTATAITPISGLNGTAGPAGKEPVVNFCVGVTFGVNGSASNIGRLAEFILEH